jgi:hypothetical protein
MKKKGEIQLVNPFVVKILKSIKMRLVLKLIIVLFATTHTLKAQKLALEMNLGLRQDFNKVTLPSSLIEEIEMARPLVQLELFYFLNEKLSLSAGVGANHYAISTILDRRLDFNAALSNQVLFSSPLALNYVVFNRKRFSLEASLGNSFIFSEKGNAVFNFGNVEEDVEGQPFAKQEHFETPSNINFIPNVGLALAYKLNPRMSLNINYQYNQGFRPIFEREIKARIGEETSAASFETNGTGIQVNFGLRYLFSKK